MTEADAALWRAVVVARTFVSIRPARREDLADRKVKNGKMMQYLTVESEMLRGTNKTVRE